MGLKPTARKYGVPPSTVRDWCRANGIRPLSAVRVYSEEAKRRVIADVAVIGVRGAARKHDVPCRTVRGWCEARGVISAFDPSGKPRAGGRSSDVGSPVPDHPETADAASRGAGPTAGAAERRVEATEAPVATGSVEPPTPDPASMQTAVDRPTKPLNAVPLPDASVPKVLATSAVEPAPATPPLTPEGTGSEEAPVSRQRQVAKRYTPSQRAEILEQAATDGVSAASQKHGVSRFSIYEWQRKLELAAEGRGESPIEGPDPNDIEAQRDSEILGEWHKHPGLGPSQIKNQLRRRGIKVSVNTVRHVMQDAGYRPPRMRTRPHDERFVAVRPDHLWHLDYLVRFIHKAKVHILVLLDDCSRYAIDFGIDDAERADMVIETFERAVERHGRPEMVIHDKGSAFWAWNGISRFTALLTEMDVEQIIAKHKQWNGKLENFNGNIQKELFDVQRFDDVAQMRRHLAAHLHWYNHERTSQALGGLLVPSDRYYGRHEEVLARIEAGVEREVSDVLKLQDRSLDLFKVVNKNGVTEVWLMGKKLLEFKPS